jgi:trk system potassium uptake protein TrkA
LEGDGMNKMNVVIGGCGRVGSFLAHMLEYEGHSVAIIDKDPLAFEKLASNFNGATVEGIVFDRRVLEMAGIERADAYLAVTSGDNSNIVSARIAKEYYHVPKVFARIYDPRRAEIYRDFGISTIASVAWSSYRLLDLISHPDMHSEYQYGNGEVQMIDLELPPTLAGRRVEDLVVPGEIHLSSIVRGHRAFLPTPGAVMEKGDRLYVNVTQESMGKLERLLGLA